MVKGNFKGQLDHHLGGLRGGGGGNLEQGKPTLSPVFSESASREGGLNLGRRFRVFNTLAICAKSTEVLGDLASELGAC